MRCAQSLRNVYIETSHLTKSTMVERIYCNYYRDERYRGKPKRLLWTFYADSGILINKSDAAIAQLVERRHGKA